jgi:hypothetical protein
MRIIRNVLALPVCLLALGFEPVADDFRWTEGGPGEEEMEIRIEVPLNQVMVLEPFDGDAVKYKKDLKVRIASGYGVLTFISITINGKLAVRMKNIDAKETGVITVAKKHLKRGENVMLVKAWHQLPGRKTRLAKFKHPEIRFKVVR